MCVCTCDIHISMYKYNPSHDYCFTCSLPLSLSLMFQAMIIAQSFPRRKYQLAADYTTHYKLCCLFVALIEGAEHLSWQLGQGCRAVSVCVKRDNLSDKTQKTSGMIQHWELLVSRAYRCHGSIELMNSSEFALY